MALHTQMRTAHELTRAINLLPVKPTYFGDLGLFEEKGSRTTSVALDIRHGRFVLVPHKDRRGEATALAGRGSKWKTRTFATAHLPLTDVLLPDDVQDLRAFGTENLTTVDQVLNDRMQDLKDSITATLEYHRTGAVKGVVYDADGEALLDLFEASGVTKPKFTIPLPTAVPTTENPIKAAIYNVKRNARKHLSGFGIKRFECMCSPAFFDALTGHALVREAYERWQAAQDRFGEDDRKGFTYGGVTFWDCSDEINGKALVEDGKAHFYPVGAGLFSAFYAPANWNETVNTVGLPFYAKTEPRRMGKGWDLEVQSNPVFICHVPGALAELSIK